VGEVGCGIHTAMAVARTPIGFKNLGELLPLMLVRWHRIRDNISSAEIIVSTDQCCDLLGDLRSILHEVHIYRNGEPVWEGPITRIEYEQESVHIFADDVLWASTRAVIEKGYDYLYPKVGYVLDTMDSLMLDCYARGGDPWHMLPTHLHPLRTANEPKHHQVVNDWQMYTWEAFDKFAEDNGTDYTVVNRDVYYWDLNVAWKVLPPLDERWISELPRLVEYGNSLATRGIVTNGRGFAGVDDAGMPTTGPKGYGLIDDLTVNSQETDTQETPSNEELLGWQETALKNIGDRWPTPLGIVVPDNTMLLPSSPWKIRDLIPGAWFEVSVTRLCRQATGWERLQELTVEELPERGETIKFTSITAPKTMIVP
jgi:hypothetical protein